LTIVPHAAGNSPSAAAPSIFEGAPSLGNAGLSRSVAPRLSEYYPRAGPPSGGIRRRRNGSCRRRLSRHGSLTSSSVGTLLGRKHRWRREGRAALEKSFDGNSAAYGAPKTSRIRPASSAAAAVVNGPPPPAGALRLIWKALYTMGASSDADPDGGNGGLLRDQVGADSARYSVDGAWMIPHSRKMLTTNGAGCLRVRHALILQTARAPVSRKKVAH